MRKARWWAKAAISVARYRAISKDRSFGKRPRCHRAARTMGRERKERATETRCRDSMPPESPMQKSLRQRSRDRCRRTTQSPCATQCIRNNAIGIPQIWRNQTGTSLAYCHPRAAKCVNVGRGMVSVHWGETPPSCALRAEIIALDLSPGRSCVSLCDIALCTQRCRSGAAQCGESAEASYSCRSPWPIVQVSTALPGSRNILPVASRNSHDAWTMSAT